MICDLNPSGLMVDDDVTGPPLVKSMLDGDQSPSIEDWLDLLHDRDRLAGAAFAVCRRAS